MFFYIDFEPFEVPRTYPRERSKYAVTNKKCLLQCHTLVSVIIMFFIIVYGTHPLNPPRPNPQYTRGYNWLAPPIGSSLSLSDGRKLTDSDLPVQQLASLIVSNTG